MPWKMPWNWHVLFGLLVMMTTGLLLLTTVIGIIFWPLPTVITIAIVAASFIAFVCLVGHGAQT